MLHWGGDNCPAGWPSEVLAESRGFRALGWNPDSRPLAECVPGSHKEPQGEAGGRGFWCSLRRSGLTGEPVKCPGADRGIIPGAGWHWVVFLCPGLLPPFPMGDSPGASAPVDSSGAGSWLCVGSVLPSPRLSDSMCWPRLPWGPLLPGEQCVSLPCSGS